MGSEKRFLSLAIIEQRPVKAAIALEFGVIPRYLDPNGGGCRRHDVLKHVVVTRTGRGVAKVRGPRDRGVRVAYGKSAGLAGGITGSVERDRGQCFATIPVARGFPLCGPCSTCRTLSPAAAATRRPRHAGTRPVDNKVHVVHSFVVARGGC